MNVHAHISGQMTNQASSQLSGLSQHNGNPLRSQIQNLGPLSMDPELLAGRKAMLEKIYNYLGRRSHPSSDDWLHRLPELAKRLEERIFKDAATKEDYMSMMMEPVEHRLQLIMRNLPKHSPLLHNITSFSSLNTMVPTPGITHNGSTNSGVSCLAENSAIRASGAGTGIANMGNLLATGNGLTDVGHSVSFNASNGLISNGYQHPPTTSAFGSGGNSISMASVGIARQQSQMIPTPGFGNLQAVSMNSGCSNAIGLSSIDSGVAPLSQQPKQYVGSQNSHVLHGIGGQIGAAMRSNLQQKPSMYGSTNGLMNGGLGLIGNNMQLGNGPVASEGHISTAYYASSPKPIPQHFDQQHHRQRIPTSLSQHMLPMAGDGYAMKGTDLSGSGSIYGPRSSTLSATNNLNTNTAGLHFKSRMNSALLTHHASLQSMQQPPHIRPQMFVHSQKVNFQSDQSTHESLLQSQQQMQQSKQHPNQPYAQFAHNQHQLQQHQESQQHQQLVLKNDTLRQSSMPSDLCGQLMTEHAVVSRNESLFPQGTEQIHLPELQTQNLQSADDHLKCAQWPGHLSGSQGLRASLSQDSQKLLHPHQQDDEFQNEINCLSGGSQPEVLAQVQWQPQSLMISHMPNKSSLEQHMQEELHRRSAGQDEAQRPHISSEGCLVGSAAPAASATVPQYSRGVTCEPENSRQKRNYLNQLRWLLFLYHARWCSAPQGKCQEPNCIKAQDLVKHMDKCHRKECLYPRCSVSKRLAHHFRNCEATNCPVCIPVREYILSNRKARAHSLPDPGLVTHTHGTCKAINVVEAERMKRDKTAVETSDDQHSLMKRMRVQHISPSVVHKSEFSPISVPPNQPHASQVEQAWECEQTDVTTSTYSEVIEGKMNTSMGSEHEGSSTIGNGNGNACTMILEIDHGVSNDVDSLAKQENLVAVKEVDQAKTEVKQEANDPQTDPMAGSRSGKPKIKGVSLTELFTPEQVREHIVSLRQWVGQSKAKAEKNQAMEHSMSENSCQLCAVEKLTFEPPPIYCTPCGARIKRNAMYYTIGSGETRHYLCIPCYNEARGETIEVDGSQLQKSKLEKKRNDEETEEWWVQCDKCEAWQHQICALFNGRRNDGGQAEYTCPNCYIEEIERGERKPLPQSAVLGAKDMPRTILSDHIEQRLFRRLKQERQERARHLGKNVDEVPGAEGLVIRVVSSVDKKLEVKQQFLEIFQDENYPTEFPYKSKAILLFQKIEGVEVCLFGMYVQEFGSECPSPNQRRVYLSYLDSVKYFRPEIKTVTGEALRTFVYHEILIGYLEYCKKRGFTSCYIWACPPLKGEDYILYCHPEIQKTPKSDKLREWYLSMLRKAAKENIVADLTNLYDHFFVTVGECKAKVTAARLPYFDGDYWPGAAEDMINQLRQEEDDRKQQKKGKIKKSITKRALKAAGQADLSSKDALLMQKLGETICPMKEDFIMVHLQHCCTHCCQLMVSGTRWVCNQCKNFQLCDKCHDAEKRLEERDRHPSNTREKHVLYPVEINDVPLDTRDKDEILESEFFDTRQAFLSLCQGNHYQYDTLRRAKHSSMMVLYHLHNPTAPAFVTTCNACHHDIETGQGWRCEVCPDFDVCNTCYQKEGGVDHPHKLTNHPSMVDQNAQNKEARQQRVLQLRKMLDLLVHASQCRFPHCQYPNCRKVKGLFRHGIHCKTRASGGCVLCKKMWYLLQLHARACKESACSVPRCRDLKEHLRRLQHQSDSRRRAAVMEMMRQRAAEVAGNNG